MDSTNGRHSGILALGVPTFLIAILLITGAIAGCDGKLDAADAVSTPRTPNSSQPSPGAGFGTTVHVAATGLSAIEGDSGNTPLTVTVSLSLRPNGAGFVYVDYISRDGSATADEDYEPVKGRLSFGPGETTKSVTIQIVGDTDYEGDESLRLLLHAAAPVVVDTPEIELTVSDDDEPVSGLVVRPSNSTCVAPERPTGNASIAAEIAFPNLPPFVKPIALLQAPSDASEWYVVEQDGRVMKFDNDPGVSSASPFVDVSGGGTAIDVDSSAFESGLLGMAFHPDYGNENHSVFLSYTLTGSPITSVIARFESLDNGATLDADDASDAEILMTVDQPFDNHNGGNVAFGPDGYLYIGFGDGGSGGDPGDRAQNTNNLFGALVRIDIDQGVPYETPSDNPFAPNALCEDGEGLEPCAEIYAWGFRNPWRWSFDDATGELWLGDVGQSRWEEIDIVELGGNYGWRCREGAHNYNTSGVCPPGLIDPVIEYSSQTVGDSVTGGYVYRGTAISALTGRYVFADYVRGKIFASTDAGGGSYSYETLLDASYLISSFAVEADGELLFLDLGSGLIYRIVPSGGGVGETIPALLSETGCVDSTDATQPAVGLIPYDVNVPFWSDGAVKERYYAIPDGTTIDVDVDGDGDWLFPNGSVLMKQFSINGELFETRLFMKHPDGVWAGYTYEWDETGTDATRVIGGKSKSVQGQTWIYPSESECMSCHTQAANFSLGIEHGQLNKPFTYPNTGITANQLTTADAVELLSDPLGDTPDNLPRYADPADTSASVDTRARAYLHSNCSGCHRLLGPTPSNMDLRAATDFTSTNTCNALPSGDTLGIPNARILLPGNPSASLIVQRPNRRDVHGMPPLASSLVDTDGVALLEQWVSSIAECPPADWQGVDVGNVDAQGSYSQSSGTFTLNASGADVWGGSDEFYYVFKSLSGDGELIARVESLVDTDPWAKAGIMIRESLSPQSKNAFMIATPGNGAGLQYRESTGGASASLISGGLSSLSVPIWLRLVRQGDTFTSYYSTDGVDWTQANQSTIAMSAEALIGIAVTSHADGTLTTAVFDNVVVTD